jgi:hypothetical protein
MTRTLLLAAAALSLIVSVPTADAGSKKHRHARPHHSRVGPIDHGYDAWPARVGPQRRGPPWAMPNECYNDEGYGRWTPCVSRAH